MGKTQVSARGRSTKGKDVCASIYGFAKKTGTFCSTVTESFVSLYPIFAQQIFSCLLHHVKGPTCFADLKKIPSENEPCTTFTEAAQKRGLLESDEIYYKAMEDACVENSNFKQLQRYFAMLLFHARPSNPRKFFDDFIDKMNPPISVNNPNMMPKSKEARGSEILRNLEYFFRGMGTTCL